MSRSSEYASAMGRVSCAGVSVVTGACGASVSMGSAAMVRFGSFSRGSVGVSTGAGSSGLVSFFA